MSPSQAEDFVAGADALQAAVRNYFISKLPTPRMSDVTNDLSGLAARFVLERQTEAVRSAVVLAGDSLGHLALPFVRPACEERIWTAYLYSLEKEPRERVLRQMSMLESTKTVTAQQQFLGSKEMKRLGFPKTFVRAQGEVRKTAEAELVRLGESLGWPSDADPLPSVGWVASQAKLDGFYSFLYSASSKGVHFSPYEVLRSGWSQSQGPGAAVTIMGDPYIQYRTAFSIHWLSLLLIETVMVLYEHGPLSGVELDDSADTVMQAAAERVGSVGRLPIALAAEFNLE